MTISQAIEQEWKHHYMDAIKSRNEIRAQLEGVLRVIQEAHKHGAVLTDSFYEAIKNAQTR